MNRQRLPARESGSSVIEFALVAFIFFMILWGFFDFGRAFYVRNTTQHITRCIARAAVVHAPSMHEAAKQECLMQTAGGGYYFWPFFDTTPQDLAQSFRIRYFLTDGTAVDQAHIDHSYDDQASACIVNVKCISYVQAYFSRGSVETLGLLATWLLAPGGNAISEPVAATTMMAESMGGGR